MKYRPPGKGFPPDRPQPRPPAFAVRIQHRAPELLRQQPSGLVGDAKLVLQLQRRHAVGMGRHEMGGPKPCRQRQPGAMHRRAAVTEVCRPQSRHSYKRGRLFSAENRDLPQAGQIKPSGQRRRNMKAAQLASSGKAFWNWASERAAAIEKRPGGRAIAAIKTLHVGYLSQRDKPLRSYDQFINEFKIAANTGTI